MSARAAYRGLLALSGRELPVISFLARLPQAMGQIATLLLISSTTGNLGSAGAVAGAVAIGQAVGGPLVGAAADRRGQRPVVLLASLANALATLVLLAAALRHAHLGVLLGLAILAGVTIPQIGPLARTRWLPLAAPTGDAEHLVDTAYSLEGALDELSFVVGPALAGVLVVVHPAAGLALTAALVGCAGVAFALHHTAPAGHARVPAAGRGPLISAPVIVLGIAMVLQGVVFGGMQTGVTALARHLGHAGLAGPWYAVMGVTSALAGAGTAALPARFSPVARLRVATGAMTVLAVPLLAVHGAGTLLPVLAVFGLTVGPYMITNFTLAGRVAAGPNLTAVMGLLTSGVVVGYAIGSSAGGTLADHHGPDAAFAVVLAAAAAAFAVATAIWRPSWYRGRPHATAPAEAR